VIWLIHQQYLLMIICITSLIRWCTYVCLSAEAVSVDVTNSSQGSTLAIPSFFEISWATSTKVGLYDQRVQQSGLNYQESTSAFQLLIHLSFLSSHSLVK